MNLTPTVGDSSWFVHDRFGLFLHWGLYALPARHEWVMQGEQIPQERYDRYFRHFNPDLYDPVAWAKTAQAAGMKYFVITTKHHEGFCLWDSALTDYKVTNTPYGRDLLAPMVEAFRAEGLRVGFYHSLIDWHHPDCFVDETHPLWNYAERSKLSTPQRVARYVDYLEGQLRELLTGFGQIDLLFLDYTFRSREGFGGSVAEGWDSERLLATIRELQPKILLNERLGLTEVPGGCDYRTPEQIVLREVPTLEGQPYVWETCQTFSGPWGYYRDRHSWKSEEQLLRMLIDTVSKGGNLLLNVGPTARGEFEPRARERLETMGEWMKRHARSLYGCGAAPEEIRHQQDCRLTYDQQRRRLYVHLFTWPCLQVQLEGLGGKVEYAQLLNDGSEVRLIEDTDPRLEQARRFGDSRSEMLTLELPVQKPPVTVPVVELFLK